MDIAQGIKIINQFRQVQAGMSGYRNDYHCNWNSLFQAWKQIQHHGADAGSIFKKYHNDFHVGVDTVNIEKSFEAAHRYLLEVVYKHKEPPSVKKVFSAKDYGKIAYLNDNVLLVTVPVTTHSAEPQGGNTFIFSCEEEPKRIEIEISVPGMWYVSFITNTQNVSRFANVIPYTVVHEIDMNMNQIGEKSFTYWAGGFAFEDPRIAFIEMMKQKGIADIYVFAVLKKVTWIMK